MSKELDLFLKTIKVGERVLSLSFIDYNDAYSFSKKNYSRLSEHFLEYYKSHSGNCESLYGVDLLRYVYIKAIESCVSTIIFSSTSRGNVCNVLHSPLDITMEKYPTDLPLHLEQLVNSFQPEAKHFSQEVVNAVTKNNCANMCVSVLNAVQWHGHAFGYHVGQENTRYKSYNCSDFLTRSEINYIAASNLLSWLQKQAFVVERVSTSREPLQKVIASRGNITYHIAFSAEIAPSEPGFYQLDFDNLYLDAHSVNAVPYYASISLGSENVIHFNDGVILSGDKVRYKINAFGELKKE